MVVSNINDITTETIDEAVAKEDLDNLISNAIKPTRHIKIHPDCSVIFDYLSKLPNSEIIEKNISNWLESLTNNNTFKNKANNEKDFNFIVSETDQNTPHISHEQIPCPGQDKE